MLDIYIDVKIANQINTFKNWLVKMANTKNVCLLKDLYKDASNNKDQNLCP